MHVDRPFLCAVVDQETKLTLFVALVVDPAPLAEGR
jgi:serine protease inhibitor